MYVKLRSLNPFRCYYSYVDHKDSVGDIFKRDNVPVTIKDVMIPNTKDNPLAIVILAIRRKEEKNFLTAMEHHKTKSQILGWGYGETFEKTVNDLHICAD